MSRRGCLRIAAVVACIAIGAVVAAAFWLRAAFFAPPEALPETLPPLPPGFTLGAFPLDAQGDLEALDLSRAGRIAILLSDPSSFQDPAGSEWTAALGDAAAATSVPVLGVFGSPEVGGWLRGKMLDMLASMGAEFPFPTRVDFGRRVADALCIPRGRAAVALIAEDGTVHARLIGAPNSSSLATLRAFLGVPAPPPPPRAPGGLPGVVEGRPAAFAFLARRVDREEVARGFGSPFAALVSGMRPPDDPSVRILTFLMQGKGGDATIVLAGEAAGFEERGWTLVPDAAELRRRLAIGEGAALVVVDREGRIALKAEGRVPMWRLAPAGNLLGFDPPFGKVASGAK